MAPRRDKMIIAAALYNVRDGSAIDLKMEPNSIQSSEPSKQLDAPRLSGGSSDRDYANKNKNQEECIGGAVSWLHGLTLCSGLALGECGVNRLLDFS
jgi:hypothetical protein